MLCWCLAAVFLPAQAMPPAGQGHGPRVALVIGNNEYTGLTALRNPVNDATDMAAALRRLGFTVELLTNADLSQMEAAVVRLSGSLGGSRQSVGLFFYAGHGVQSGNSNYLIPSRVSIPAEAFLRERALSAQVVLDLMQQSGNALNLVFLDACRDNPFGWARSGSRGLSVVGNQPPGSIIVYATSAGSTAADGSGRNGVFTGELLQHLERPGLELSEILDATARGVLTATGNRQNPAVYKQFFESIVLQPVAATSTPAAAAAPTVSAPSPTFGNVTVATGSLTISIVTAGTVTLLGQVVQLPAGSTLPVNNVTIGDIPVTITYLDGRTETSTVRVEAGRNAAVNFSYRPVTPNVATPASPPPAQNPAAVPAAGGANPPLAAAVGLAWTNPAGIRFLAVPGGNFTMGDAPAAGSPSPLAGGTSPLAGGTSPLAGGGAPAGGMTLGSVADNRNDERPAHPVTLAPFWMSATEVTQAQYEAVMGNNPAYFMEGADAPARPVERVSWYDALVFCNKLSMKEGLTPVYSIAGSTDPARWGAIPTANNEASWDAVVVNRAANGYRLPTEAEWEYAARGASASRNFSLAGGSEAAAVAWFVTNAHAVGENNRDYGTHRVGLLPPNELGLVDMSGNVWEWCFDRYGPYVNNPLDNPLGATSGAGRVFRGGSWTAIAAHLRSSNRDNRAPGGRYTDVGFRIVRSAGR
ncbi:MAG: hypothetical protein A2087_04075 [Spirochaetes bacterium GWD1_61_31]|nr:MAG: hypothetical protein A2Y37_02275 [Spirochaetes bacterium GWB1_60_80]OHD33304.1 MAG: hypothetical protein A2004_07645 [Spirochaetes bacterium GWC1_61_12]OHD41575.1 MAG: hypothetical protein A2Y35_02415 [Spirochaetes bacterium GWE1_60_18]OHD44317.1 MAG: hypothetical protein A2087_04075 [Spirochaetes bacterium GWD1_61_31]OHD61480.1 MAG: hypothetical protein A2Y32_02685 [Spirochaetes bacterium GWF1_60_12]